MGGEGERERGAKGDREWGGEFGGRRGRKKGRRRKGREFEMGGMESDAFSIQQT